MEAEEAEVGEPRSKEVIVKDKARGEVEVDKACTGVVVQEGGGAVAGVGQTGAALLIIFAVISYHS